MIDDQGGDLTILVPMLGRPHRVAPLLMSITATVPNAEVIWCCTPGDDRVLAEVDRVIDEKPLEQRRILVDHARGDYARKINIGYRESDRDLLFTGACDLLFRPGWYVAVLTQFVQFGVGVVGTNDLGASRVMAGDHATHSLVSRWYADHHGTIDQRGQILHEGYWHEYSDDELVATAKYRMAWVHAADSHVEHLHPDYKKAPHDSLYLQQRRRMRQGEKLFRQREALWT